MLETHDIFNPKCNRNRKWWYFVWINLFKNNKFWFIGPFYFTVAEIDNNQLIKSVAESITC